MILNFRTRFAMAGHTPDIVRFAQGERRKMQRAGLIDAEVSLGSHAEPLSPEDGPPVVAFVNAANLGGRFGGWEGRWVAQCDACAGAEYVDLDQPIFMCNGCFNAAVGYQWRRVTLPAAATRTQIEALLEARPGNLRNWLPHESVAELRRQNDALSG